MAAYGAGTTIATAVGTPTSVDSPSLNVTGTDLALVAGGGSSGGGQSDLSFEWGGGGGEAMTEWADITSGTYLRAALAYLDDPTAANDTVTISQTTGTEGLSVFAAFFTVAADIVGTDTANDTTGNSLSSTVPNVATGDMVIDFVVAAHSGSPTLTPGANQTERDESATDAYTSMAYSTQEGADGGVMSYTASGSNYDSIHIAGRIPDAGGGGPTANPKGALGGVVLGGPFGGPTG